MEWPGLGNGHTIGLHQEMEGMHDQEGDAGDSSVEMPNMPPAILAQETDAGGPAIKGDRGVRPRYRSPSAGDPAQRLLL
jgi:hypothetical protein